MRPGFSALALALLIFLMLALWQSPVSAPAPASAYAAAIALPAALAPSVTPFQPQGPTSTPAATPTPVPPSPTPPPPHPAARFDLSQPLRLVIAPRAAAFNQGREMALAIKPGSPCGYLDFRACLSWQNHERWLLITLHSGVGGSGEPLRGALEGMGWNQAAASLAAVRGALDAMTDSAARLEQGARAADLRVLAAARIPAAQVADYYRLPVDQAFALAAQSQPGLADLLASGQPLLVIETCGWQHPEEPPVPGLSDTSAAVYLLFLGE